MAAPAQPASLATRREAVALAARLPGFAIAAKQLAHSVAGGLHGRRRAGPGENFWQFRPFLSGEPAARVDWRRSAREDRAFVREREWEAAHDVWIWFDRSASMDFASPLAKTSKLARAATLALASAQLLARGGERVGLLGLATPSASPAPIERLAQALARDASSREPLPPGEPLKRRAKALLIGDFLSDAQNVERTLASLAADGAQGQLVMVADPIEETFPFSGHVEFLETGGTARLLTPRAQSLRSAYLDRLGAHRERTRGACRRLGWGFALHRTDASAAAALLALWARWRDAEAPAARRA